MRIIQESLKNKLRYLLVEDRNSPSVTIMILVAAGSRYEQDKTAGVAHFIEHTFFKGTKSRPTSKKIGMDIELLGGESNAFTSHDYTGYYIKVPKINFQEAFEILADMLNNSLFAIAEIEKERGVIIEEIKMYEDIPRSKINRIFDQELFSNHPLGRDIAGSIESVSKIGRNDFLSFIDEFYTGENILVSIAGSFDTERAQKLISQHFNSLKPGEKGKFEKAKPRKLTGKISFHEKAIEQTHVILGGFAHERDYANRFVTQTGNSLLSYGFGSRLYQVLRDELGLAYYVGSGISSFAEIGKYKVSMGVDNKKVDKAIAAVLTELSKLARGEFEEMELERAKQYLIGSYTTQLEASDDKASWYGLQAVLREEFLTISELIERIKKVTKNEVVEEWRKLLTNDNLQITVLGPETKLLDKINTRFDL